MSCASRPRGFSRRVYLLGVLTAGLLATGFVTRATIAALAPDRSDGRISKAVARFLADEHLSKAPLNEEMSRRTFTTFMKMLDPMKVYFLQSDVDEFATRRSRIPFSNASCSASTIASKRSINSCCKHRISRSMRT